MKNHSLEGSADGQETVHLLFESISANEYRAKDVMKVIGAGYGRTGTATMMEALTILGFGPCYHSLQVFRRLESPHSELWLDGYQGKGLDVSQILRGYQSVMDWPAADFYKDIVKEFPEAKVILTVRDPEAWWRSISGSIHMSEGPLSRSWGLFFFVMFVPFARKWWYMIQHVDALHMSQADAKAALLRHNAEVRAHVPAEKLLEFSVQEGWGPLCEFLQVPVPDEPFPRTNSGSEMTLLLGAVFAGGWILLASIIALLGTIFRVVLVSGGAGAAAVFATVTLCYVRSCYVLAKRTALRGEHTTNGVENTWASLCGRGTGSAFGGSISSAKQFVTDAVRRGGKKVM